MTIVARFILPAALAAILSGSAGLAAQAEQGPPVAVVRVAIEKWVETRQAIAKERHDWELGREMLHERIGVLTREIDAAGRKVTESAAGIAASAEKLADMQARRARLEGASTTLAATVTALETRLRGLLPRLPAPLQERVTPLRQRLPDGTDRPPPGLGERFQNVIGIMNEIDKWNGAVHMVTEVRPLPDGSRAEVTAVYAGIAQGWFVDAKGAVAGVGRPSDSSWEWTAANDSAPAIKTVIAILQNEHVARFVPLPVRIQ